MLQVAFSIVRRNSEKCLPEVSFKGLQVKKKKSSPVAPKDCAFDAMWREDITYIQGI